MSTTAVPAGPAAPTTSPPPTSGIIYDVDLALDIKRYIDSNPDVSFDGDTRSKILSADNDTVLKIGKIIGSPVKIVSVDIINADYFRNNLFMDE